MSTYFDETPKRLDGGDPRSATFNLHQNKGIAIYGGFAGTETTRSQRNWTAHPTILSGDLSGNDGPNFSNNGENNYHVLTISYTEGLIIVDGFTISGGNANNPADCSGDARRCHDYGGGITNVNMANPTLTNLLIQNNYASYSGGGMFNFCDSHPSLTNVTFNNNQTGYAGGGLANSGHPTDPNCKTNNPTLTNVAFYENMAQSGGGMYNRLSNATLKNALFSGNKATVFHGGGLMNDKDSHTTLTNATFSNNSAADLGGGINNEDDGSSTLTNSILWNNSDNTGSSQQGQISNVKDGSATVSYSLVQGTLYPGPGNLNSNPLFLDADGPDNIVGTTDDDLRLGPNSPAIDKGNAAACPTSDLRGVARPQGAGCDMGAYEVNYSLQVSLISNPFPVLTTTTRITYTISLWVVGDIPLTGVSLTAQIPNQTTFISASDGGLHTNGQITWSGLSLSAGATLNRTFVVSVTSTLNEGDLLVNTLTATSTEGVNLSPTQIPTIVNPKFIYLPLILR